ncbi:MAG: hypothetical protein JWN95_2126 [Frankiales bacterium]|nr:hypothetical protein [Frankiales bacterium]
MTSAIEIGATGEPYEYVVERGKVREFATATKARGTEYFTDSDAVAPPSFLMTAVFWSGPGSYPLKPGALVGALGLHGEQEFIFHGEPPRIGDRLTAQQKVEDSYVKQGRRGGEMLFVVVNTEFRDETGRLVAESRQTVIQTSQAAGEPS